ncbi:Multidrug resistance-associated protein 9 [Thoreauomyces humboldtii]|nr:Multidrug resistance-associated protein 9 [Thoreauomyces humboldtii]
MRLRGVMRVRAILIGAVYEKSLRVRAGVRSKPAEVNVLVAADVKMLESSSDSAISFSTGCAQVAFAMVFIARLIGISTVVAAVLYVGLAFAVGLGTPKYMQGLVVYRKALGIRTKRLRELIGGLTHVKFHALEDRMVAPVHAARNEQLLGLRIMLKTVIFTVIVLSLQQSFIGPITILVWTRIGGGMSAATVFPLLGLLSQLIGPSSTLPPDMQILATFRVSYPRLTTFLLAPEDDPTEVASREETAELAVHLANASFEVETSKDVDSKKVAAAGAAGLPSITDTEKFQLSDIDLSIPHGSLVCIVGDVGSGKSSLLLALLGRLRKTAGDAVLAESCAYCPQHPWVLSGTVRENILGQFSEATEEAVWTALRATGLDEDLDRMPNGLGERIGEKGITLSGGQKARLGLVRALASPAKTLLLDDPLAALDATLSSHVFEQAILGMCTDRTVLLVTNQMHLVPRSDMVIVMKDGKIAESGTFEDLCKVPGSQLAELLHHQEEEHQVVMAEDTKQMMIVKPDIEAKKEHRDEGQVGWRTFFTYLLTAGILIPASFFTLFAFLLAVSSLERIILVVWSANKWGWSDDAYFNLFLGVSIGRFLLVVPGSSLTMMLCYTAGKKLHDTALAGLMTAPLSYFDDQPLGRVLNRMTTDVQALDLRMSILLNQFSQGVMPLLTAVVLICYSSPYFLIQLAVLAVPAILMYRFYIKSYRELKRLSSVLTSPLLSHISESLDGISTISAYGAATRFIIVQREKTDLYNKSQLFLDSTKAWFTLRLDLLAATIAFTLLILAGAGVIAPAVVGLALVSAIEIGSTVNRCLLLWGDTEITFNSVERLDHYAKDLPVEGPRRLPHDPFPSEVWPAAGLIEVDSLEVRYPNSTTPALRSLSLTVQPGETLGICGRSGAGKSSFARALFRITEASDGRIAIDGVDLATLGLDYRGRLAIVLQDPVLFSGSLRSNLDVTDEYSDADVWDVLNAVGMGEFVGKLPGKLDHVVEEQAGNLSAGQRQLICLAAALLVKPTVLILDEATSAIDTATDARIQKVLRERLPDTTKIVVAHRLQSIAMADRIMVLGQGELLELGAPRVLLNDLESQFSILVDAAGSSTSKEIRELANSAT